MAKTVIIQAQQKWDYRSETRRTDASLVVTLNELGQSGWEVIDVLYHKDPKGEMAWTAILKRPNAGATANQQGTGASSAVLQPAGVIPTSHQELRGFDLSENEFRLRQD
jgi:hypothetical protein